MIHQESFFSTIITHSVLCIIIASLAIKLFFIARIGYKKTYGSFIHTAPYYLLTSLFFSLFSDFAWLVKLFHKIIMPESPYTIVTFFIRIGWASIALQHQYLSLFIQELPQKKRSLSLAQRIITGIAYLFCIYFLYNAFFNENLISKKSQILAQKIIINPPLEVIMMRFVSIYLTAVLMVPGLAIIINHARSSHVPKIVKRQLLIFTLYFMCPYLAIELLQALAITFSLMEQNLYAIVGLATLLLIIALHYALKHIVNLRFMNWTNHVINTSHKKHATIFKQVIENLSQSHTFYEFQHITQQFFAHSFSLKTDHITLHLMYETPEKKHHNTPCLATPYHAIDALLSRQASSSPQPVSRHRIAVYDDIAFNNFYADTRLNTDLIHNLDSINADIFLPLYRNNCLIAAIMVKKNARISTCYNESEQDEMLIFANYLSNSINLIHTKKSDIVAQRIHGLTKELSLAHQKTMLFKEAVRSSIRTTTQQHIGILFYQNNLFLNGNQYTYDLLPFSLNHHKGHPIVKQISNLAHNVICSKTTQSLVINHAQHKQPIVITGSMQLNKKTVLITAHQASIAHLLYEHDYLLQHEADWIYLLFLQTTHIGAQLNNYLPTFTEYILNLKISILRFLLTPYPLLILAPEHDCSTILSWLSYTQNNKTIHQITITTKEQKPQTAYLLFGKRADINTPQQYGLLEKIESNDIIVIKNIHLLCTEGQQKLATFIESGIFTSFDDDTVMKQSPARIIVTTSSPIRHILSNNMLNKTLYLCIKQNKLVIPPVNTWPLHELMHLIDTIIQHIETKTPLYCLMPITNNNKRKLSSTADSIHTLHKKINAIFEKNSQKKITPYLQLTESELEHLSFIAQLGKKVLKDSATMKLLWHLFHNQHAIARLLGVQASSVYKKCKQYELH